MQRGPAIATLLSALALLLGTTGRAPALEIELPAGRELRLHGFYEARLALAGEGVPLARGSPERFRHALQLEVEVDLFPEGVGPFDTLRLYGRGVLAYECLYERACGLLRGADHFGGARRRPRRVPAVFAGDARPSRVYVGGFHGRRVTALPQLTLERTRPVLSPGRRLRSCFNGPDEYIRGNPALYGPLCNGADPSLLTGPHHGAVGGSFFATARVHAGAFALPARFGLLGIARADLGEARHAELLATLLPDADGRIVGGLTPERESLRRGLLAAGRVDEAAALRTGTFDAAIDELLATRRDTGTFERIARSLAPELLEARWGAGELGDLTQRYLASLDMPLRPDGYLRGTALDLVNERAQGLAAGIPGRLSVQAYLDFAGPDNPFIRPGDLERGAVPLLVGPDGLANTADDLPSTRSGVRLRGVDPAGSLVGAGFDYEGAGVVEIDGQMVELYGIRDREQLRRRACAFLLDRPLDFPLGCTPADVGLGSPQELERLGCRLEGDAIPAELRRVMGFNADGHCIHLNVADEPRQQRDGSFEGGVDPRVLVALGAPGLRPAGARSEPIDLTDLLARARAGAGLPARPRAADGGLYFDTQGHARFRRRHRRSVSNLDLDFGESELRWSHGAAEDEHELRELRLDFELLDGQLRGRVGKLLFNWGKTELFRNTDRFNPLDTGGGLLRPLEELRIGQWAASFTLAPDAWLRAGPFEDLRLELAVVVDDLQRDDPGRCGEPSALPGSCQATESAIGAGLLGYGLVGAVDPWHDRGSWLERMDVGLRLEGRLGRFSFEISDFWGWDDVPTLEIVHRHARLVDDVTGAPLRAGGATCRWRAADGSATSERSLSVGPNGVDGDDDDAVPSAGDCLLWAPPDASGRQRLRDPDAIAASHGANQTLFHLTCTLSFDPEDGYCDQDVFNSPQRFEQLAAALGGDGGLIGVLLGLDRIRAQVPLPGADSASIEAREAALALRLQEIGASRLFAPVNATGNIGVDLLAGTGLTPEQRAGIGLGPAGGLLGGEGALTVEQGALLGCGPAYGTPCGRWDLADFTGQRAHPGSRGELGSLQLIARLDAGDPLTPEILGVDPEAFAGMSVRAKREILDRGRGTLARSLGRLPSEVVGGIDLLNADASVLLQESSILKAWAPDMLVGTRLDAAGRLVWLPGINTARERTPELDHLPRRLELPAEAALALGPAGRRRLASAAFNETVVDGWVEPAPWQLDPYWEARGVILYRADPERPFGHPDALEISGGRLIGGDPQRLEPGTSNAFRKLADGTPYGEYCGPAFASTGVDASGRHAFNGGCSSLEIISANHDRLLMATEIVGSDREFDPPETLAELSAWIDHELRLDPDAALRGDPVSGPDGILARNHWADLDFARTGRRADAQDVIAVRASPGVSPSTFVSPFAGVSDAASLDEEGRLRRRSEFVRGYDPASCPDLHSGACHLKLSLSFAPGSQVLEDSLPFDRRPDELVASLPIAFPAERVGDGARVRVNLLRMDLEQRLDLARLLAGEAVVDPDSGAEVRLMPAQRAALLGENGEPGLDLDRDGVPDLDRDRDHVYDGIDDYTPGPVTDDNVLCGSGIPGDPLQDAIQFEPYLRSEARDGAAFAAALGELPPRSPVFCSANAGMLASTRSTLPLKKARGDGRYGRLQFAWHDGQQVALDHRKHNVFGIGLDFTEDVTRTTWGVEASYAARRWFADSRDTVDGRSRSDEAVLSVSVDRTAYLRFLNPDSSFFVNFQMFLRWLTDYEGGEDDLDGFYGHTSAPLTSLLTLNVQTRYFQGRVEPQVTLIHLPQEAQLGLIAEMRYQWTPSVSTTVGFMHFAGRAARAEAFYDPVGPGLGSPENRVWTGGGLTRGLTSVLNRDEVFLDLRVAW